MRNLALLALVFTFFWSCKNVEEKDIIMDSNSADSLLRHVVMFKFKDSSSVEDINKVVEAFHALPEKIKEIKAYEWGTNNSPEGLNEGLTHCFVISFASEEDRAVYLPHPEHQAFVEVLKPHLDKVTVIDYWSKTP